MWNLVQKRKLAGKSGRSAIDSSHCKRDRVCGAMGQALAPKAEGWVFESQPRQT